MDRKFETAIYMGIILGLVLFISMVSYRLGGQEACNNGGGQIGANFDCIIEVNECQLREIQRSAKALSQNLPLGNWKDLGIGEDK